ncbi:SRPBCC domain-containing protein [Sulfolobus acidocaldarius]|uniref:Conserved Archaeal protein n=5 Tax=Sulfolobus acidocaldarius TaxID=2285 RepID=Q4J9R0_SULAC|nr:SRPBCC domain-containing protein [Sulfolobus acidocaldarius]AAY80471.1 conserved Archaeal protein [Sulfolobus acidocaldarius DSM 639]AGE71056.1 carbon monoxide dehydrogenase subunit G [Sulfolobus acidocaldarius N8]AGE73327.1 carbon monoxide dehydrogenase subunit G [Sulfolobus acidocaldarius Ron12/I]ALU28656.1 carbon monoxide dehydrogenase [Sulfolobus acidocaldarius]ALU31372.1 carbon monoxide dehydrogenase [Sulfolobus acidocaldarius]
MEMSGKFLVEKSEEKVKELLTDPKMFSQCLPGIQNYEISGESFKAVFKIDVSEMRIPHITTLTASINATITTESNNQIHIKGNGRSAGVSIKMDIVLDLGSEEGKTAVKWTAILDMGMLTKLLGESNIRQIAESNVKSIISCLSRV